MESTETAKKMIQESLPDFSVKHIELAGEGTDSRSFFVNDIYVFRFPKRPKVAEDLKNVYSSLWASSSAGQSSGLINRRSAVQILPRPPPRPPAAVRTKTNIKEDSKTKD